MDELIIEGGTKTPSISLSRSIIEIKGKSIPENSVEFYQPVLAWLDQFAKQPNGKTQVTVQLEYFNTSSSKCLLDIFRRLEKIHSSGTEVSVSWLFEEDDE